MSFSKEDVIASSHSVNTGTQLTTFVPIQIPTLVRLAHRNNKMQSFTTLWRGQFHLCQVSVYSHWASVLTPGRDTLTSIGPLTPIIRVTVNTIINTSVKIQVGSGPIQSINASINADVGVNTASNFQHVLVCLVEITIELFFFSKCISWYCWYICHFKLLFESWWINNKYFVIFQWLLKWLSKWTLTTSCGKTRSSDRTVTFK